MRDKAATLEFYSTQLGFQPWGSTEYDEYLMLQKDHIQLHFFLFKELDPAQNDGQVYIRTNDIDGLYRSMLANKRSIHPAGHLQVKPWGLKEFSMLDPDNNLLTFGEAV